MVGFVMMFLVIAANFAAAEIAKRDGDLALSIDTWSLGVVVGGWVLFHCAILWMQWRDWPRERWEAVTARCCHGTAGARQGSSFVFGGAQSTWDGQKDVAFSWER